MINRIVLLAILLTSCGGQSPAVLQNNCSVTQNNGSVTIKCPDGSQTTFSNAQIVQFCPGTTVYPSIFNEVGICTNTNLYAVYSANNGFLTLIPPGTYQSNAIGSSCNFTVYPNCVVVPQ